MLGSSHEGLVLEQGGIVDKLDGEEDCREDCDCDPEEGGSHGALKLLPRGCCTVEGGVGSEHHVLLPPHEPVPVPTRWQTWKS